MVKPKIFKYPISPNEKPTELELPFDALVISFEVVGGQPCLYAVVNPSFKLTERRKFLVVGTGWDIPELDHAESYRFIGTAVAPGSPIGDLVWHAFEIIGPKPIALTPEG